MHFPNIASAAEDSGNRVVITVTGANRPGIVAAFSKVLGAEGVDIRDLSQKVVSDLFVMLILGDLSSARSNLLELRERLRRIGEEMHLEVSVQHERLFRFIDRV